MTIKNYICDFCGRYCGHMGCDTKVMIENSLWDGQCEAGLIWRFRNDGTNELKAMMLKHENLLKASGLTIENRGTDYQKWWDFLKSYDLIFHIEHEIKRREEYFAKFKMFDPYSDTFMNEKRISNG